MNADKNDETKINMIMEEANEQCEQMTTKILSIVLNEFPKKIEQIDKLRKKFDWKMILTLKRNDIKSISNMIVNQLMTIKQKNDQHHQPICIQNGDYKPFLFCLNESNNNNQNNDNKTITMIETNEQINELIEQLKPYIIELIDLTTRINFALETLSPQIQDGHNFGVHVQTKAMIFVGNIHQSCCEQLTLFQSYYNRRQSSLNYCLLYPQLNDYQNYHYEIECDTLYSLCLSINQLYNFYASINDFVVKNLQKLIHPRD
ncbi:Proteasome activator complex subunit 3 [Dermatophagoides pteronyssinus]|uniref:Proteasome activator complex subunit 3 n=1 Tax=Dermatophagoides pteronyssinus TaxID=6956 RepID=A0ABQ8JLX4_DERPT|nr:Proteasome activator complex subunit 3 [Dermatophagoides pteronyssinus]